MSKIDGFYGYGLRGGVLAYDSTFPADEEEVCEDCGEPIEDCECEFEEEEFDDDSTD